MRTDFGGASNERVIERCVDHVSLRENLDFVRDALSIRLSAHSYAYADLNRGGHVPRCPVKGGRTTKKMHATHPCRT